MKKYKTLVSKYPSRTIEISQFHSMSGKSPMFWVTENGKRVGDISAREIVDYVYYRKAVESGSK